METISRKCYNMVHYRIANSLKLMIPSQALSLSCLGIGERHSAVDQMRHRNCQFLVKFLIVCVSKI